MIAHIQGIVSEKNTDNCVIDVSGVGFELSVSSSTLSQLPKLGESAKLYVYMAVREDAMELYGFFTKEEKKMFLRLISVTGIGPRTALGVLSALSVHDLSVALVTGDAAALARAPGIGKKTAQRLVLELKDKVDNDDLTGKGTQTTFVPAAKSAEAEAIEALMALGYASNEAAKAVSEVAGQADTTGEVVRLALRRLGGGF